MGSSSSKKAKPATPTPAAEKVEDTSSKGGEDAGAAVSTEDAGAPVSTTDGAVLQLSNMNQQILKMQYAVRGEVPILANKIREELASGTGPERPFKEVVQCNIGNPQACGQKPVTYYRQVLALCDAPMLMEHPKVNELFPQDVVDRARDITGTIKGGTGAYSHSQGIPSIRQNVADFIEARDGFPCNPADLFLTNGASAGLNMVFTIMMAHPDDAILVPIPQYPIYSALASMTGARLVGYYLDEAAGWTLTEAELTRAITEARKDGAKPKAMVVINPGNPTGQCMDEADLQMIVKFCQRERLVLLADEVYQENVYAETKSFTSLKKVVKGLGPSFENFELMSFHSTSKGIIGECGRRGGYMELVGVDKDVQAQLFKLSCTGLCSNIDGQIMTDLMVKGPQEGGASFELFQTECKGLFEDLKRKSANLVKALNEIDGLTCNPPEGALYAFVKFDLPDSVLAHCKTLGKSPDLLYCLSLLETEGVCCVPGSGFGQAEGSWHFRTTFLPPEEQMVAMPEKIAKHHKHFLASMCGSN